MKIRITANKPKRGDEKSISHLIGREFQVKEQGEGGIYIGYGETGLYFLYPDEFETVEETS